MKKGLLVLLMVLPVLLASCSKDEDKKADSIVGTWREIDDSGGSYRIMELRSDNSGTLIQYTSKKESLRLQFKYLFNMEKQTLTIIYQDNTETLKAVLSGNILTVGEVEYKRH